MRWIERLIALFHHRWAVPTLAELCRSSGCKFVTLVNRLGASRGGAHKERRYNRYAKSESAPRR